MSMEQFEVRASQIPEMIAALGDDDAYLDLAEMVRLHDLGLDLADLEFDESDEDASPRIGAMAWAAWVLARRQMDPEVSWADAQQRVRFVFS